jgi:serine/threonine protein kinase
MDNIIGGGTYGTIYKIKKDGKTMAVKKIKCENDNIVSSILEISIMTTYIHPLLNNAIHVEYTSEGEIDIYQIMAMYDLKTHLKRVGSISEDLARDWTEKLATGLQFLQKEYIVHGDIKPHNILVYDNNTIKLADFGCCTILEGDIKKGTVGTTRYSSPEMLLRSEISYAGDIWSLGCVIYEMLCGTPLIPPITKNDVSRKYRTVKSIQNWRETRGETIYKKLGPLKCLPISFHLKGKKAKLIDSMLKYDKESRITLEDLLTSEWLNIKFENRYYVDIFCRVLNSEALLKSEEQIKDYIYQANIKISPGVLQKTINIYSLTNMTNVAQIEACLIISAKFYRYHIDHYRPKSPRSKINRIIVDICKDHGFRLHKSSFDDLFLKLGS